MFQRQAIDFSKLKPISYSPIMIRAIVSDDIRRVERELSYRELIGTFEIEVPNLGVLMWDTSPKAEGRYRIYHDDERGEAIPLVARPYAVRQAWYPHLQTLVDQIAEEANGEDV